MSLRPSISPGGNGMESCVRLAPAVFPWAGLVRRLYFLASAPRTPVAHRRRLVLLLIALLLLVFLLNAR